MCGFQCSCSHLAKVVDRIQGGTWRWPVASGLVKEIGRCQGLLWLLWKGESEIGLDVYPMRVLCNQLEESHYRLFF